jgi:hypothetical protein
MESAAFPRRAPGAVIKWQVRWSMASPGRTSDEPISPFDIIISEAARLELGHR